MTCKNCSLKPVYKTLNDRSLCRKCFIKYFEKKVLRTIRLYGLIEKDDVVVCGFSGGKDSATNLYMLNNLLKRYGKQPIALAIDEGIKGYRNKTLDDAKKFCKKYKIPLKIVSFKKEFKKTLDQFLRKWTGRPCTPCGVFRRYLLNKGARELGATKLATGHNLDDEAQSILMNQVKGNVQLSAKLGPMTGVLVHKKFIRRIKPLYFMSEKEVTIYSKLQNFPVQYVECPNFNDNFRDEIGNILNSLESKYPGTKHGVVNAFLQVLPSLKERYQHDEIGTCASCGEPANKDRCKACELLER